LVTLSSSNTAVNDIDFTDISQIAVSGKITNSVNPTCLNDTTIEILVNDSSWSPRVYANSNGEYIVEFEPGFSPKISPKRAGYLFTPAFYQLDSLTAPLAQKNFAQVTTYNLTVQVAGGKCELALGGTTNVKITPLPDCGGFTRTQQITGTAKSTTFTGLGPGIFKIEVTRLAGDIIFEADTVDLRNGSRLKKMTYYAPLQVVASNLTPSVSTTCPPDNVPILEQLKKYKLTYKAVEIYNGVECVVTGSKFIFTNEIADADGPDSLFAPSGAVVDSFYAGLPNILPGGPHPYQKQILIRAVDSLGRESAPFSYWALVTGVKPRAGNTFATTSPELPLAILRQPPGDLSSSFWSQSSTLTQDFSVSNYSSDGSVQSYMFSTLPTIEIGLGKGFVTTSISTVPILQFPSSVTVSHSNTKTNQLRTTLQINENIATYNPSQNAGIKGDIIFGLAYNVIYGITDSIKWDPATCSVKTGVGLSVAPDSIKTKFLYTEDYIRNTHIPNLYTLGTRRDSLHAKNWKNLLSYNDSLKLKSADSLQNISFSSGGVYSYSRSYSVDSILTFATTFDTLNSNSMIGGLLINNAGGTTEEGEFHYRIGSFTETYVNTTSNTTGFTLADDDPGDGFTVNIAQDKVFGTPVFRTVAGQSSCPYEPGTFERDKAVFTVKHVAATNVHPDSTVIWPIRLGNASSTDETRPYTLRVLNETNPNGLVIAVNGIIIQNNIMFTLPKGTIQTMLMVRRSAGIYNYSGIKLVLSPMCESYGQADSQSDTLTIDAVNFLKPCSPIAITAPDNNWLVNSFSDNRLAVTIAGYDTSNTDFFQVKLQYRRMVGGASRPFGGFARNPIAAIDGSDLIPHIDLTGYPVESFPWGTNPDKYYRNQVDSYDASVEDRFSLLTGSLYERIYRDVVLKGYNYLDGINGGGNGSVANVKKNAADAEEGSSSVTPDNPENLWTNFKIIPKDSLRNSPNQGYYTTVWLNSGLDEGQYEIRAVSNCNGSTIEATSALLGGMIDKTGPMVQGSPQPMSGILTLTDQIGITFTENILPSTAIKGTTVRLFYSSGPQSGQPIDFNFSCDGRSIIITPNIADRFLENQTLKAVVNKIKDLNGNYMRVPLGTAYVDSIAWEFVVQKSPVRWAGGDIEIVKYSDETVQVTRELKNISGFPTSYYLRNIPAWLGVSSISGIVPNQGNVPITFTFGPNVSSGLHEFTITDSTIYGDQPLRVRLLNACRPPSYAVNPANFEYSMNIIGKLFIGGSPSTDVNDKVGVFAGQIPRGFANVQRLPDGEYRVFLTVYSNQLQGEVLTMRVWDSTACNEYGQVLESFTFAANSVIGTYLSPASITATTQVLQPYKFSNGWNWMSVNTVRSDMSVTSVLTGMHPTDGDIIKYSGSNAYSQWVPSANIWFGPLDTLRPGLGYLMRLAAKDSLTLSGTAASPAALKVKLAAGWNYIGYIPQNGMSVNSALASLKPTAGDLVKSQFAFATYTTTNGWVGNLFSMEPRLGYLIKVAKADTLTYPVNPPSAAPFIPQDNNFNPVLADNPEWNVEVGNYQYTMSLIAELGEGIVDSITENTAIGVFADNVCRGFATPLFISEEHPNMFFITVYSNAVSGEQLSFRLYDPVSQQTSAMNSGISFEVNGILGSPESPFIIMGTPLDIKDGKAIPAQYELAQNYPNPFNPSTMINYALPKDGTVKLVIHNIMGQVVRVLVDDVKDAGYYSVSWDGRNNFGTMLPSGVYLYTIYSGDFTATKKLTLMK
ncbi:MAG: T9SS type A sorting domain-containing protein, partial [Ignavibacteriaceae bacterium]|nr:T9SS type A sorting domain-containing protein [Ignavibacteriaceae bacterium]